MTALAVAVPEGRLALSETGHGPPVLLVHGGTGTGAHEWRLVRAHAARSHRVVTIDIRAHGSSPNHGGPMTTRRFAADLVHVMARLGIPRADLVGFSLGANTVLELMCQRPELARRAVLVGGSATGDPERVRTMEASPEWPAELRDLRHAVDESPDYWRRLRSDLMRDWAMNTEVPVHRLARVSCPVLVVSGARDPVQRGPVAEHLAASLPDAHLVVLADAGHAVHHDQPERFNALLDGFLTPPSGVSATLPVAVPC